MAELGDWTLRSLDEEECRAGGLTPAEALRDAIERSDASYVFEINGRAVCAWGYRIACVASPVADVWMLSFSAAEHYRIALGRAASIVASRLGRQMAMRVLVWKEHGVARRWLERLGFTTVAATGEFLLMRRG